MKLVRYQNPLADSFGELDRWFRSPADGFGRLFELADRLAAAPSGSTWSGHGVDLYEDDEHYYARLEMPGVKKKDLKLELQDHQLSVSYERASGETDGESRERASATRMFAVPDGVDAAKVSAKLEDGILTVTLPKSAERKPREIKVS